MHVSPFFRDLRSAYLAELDDMRHDSEGQYVLDRRLAERRGELGFLVHMMELSPEMVAVVLHKAFQFRALPAMERLLACEAGSLPAWDSLQASVSIAPWAQDTVQQLRKHAAGDDFLCVAAALEFMAGGRPAGEGMAQGDEADDADDAGREDDEDMDARQPLSADDIDDADAQTREDARADWMAEQGFDRKD
ncbi:hypothetical protein [Pseudorhodoferax sp.]|uniref:hypothetical protein n=1 Tax=Pseudorhodoferax sp. TaxID=1993553 RepID=UPI002DD69D69|nr:hypothetical protein [Pseudorhodoferax sp.]